jgi:hypothetical protein
MEGGDKRTFVNAETGQEVAILPIEAPKDAVQKDRLTSKMINYCEHIGFDPVQADLTYTGFLETFELEVQKKWLRKVEPTWQPLPLGDLLPEQVGEVIVQNLVGKNLDVNPTDAEKARFAKQSFRIRKAGVEGGLEIVILPGGMQKIYADKGTLLEIKCDFEEGKGLLWIFPR